jgi:hypothetical protein
MRSSDAAQAVLEGLRAEAQAEIDAIDAYLTEHSDASRRALRTRQGTLAEVRAKISRYEEATGGRLAELHASIAALRGRVAGAITAAEEGAQGIVHEEGARLLEIVEVPRSAPVADPADGDADPSVVRASLLEIDDAPTPATPNAWDRLERVQ